MEGDQSIEADVFVQLGEGSFVALVGTQVVAGRKRMLGVEAQAQAFVFVSCVEDLAHLFELVAEVAALSRGDFERDFDLETRAGLMRLAKRLRDGPDAGVLAGTDVR